jgi:hypothetical protein
MDDLFLRIQQAIDMDAFSAQVAYHEETGHTCCDIYIIDYDDRILVDAHGSCRRLPQPIHRQQPVLLEIDALENVVLPRICRLATMSPKAAAATDVAASVRNMQQARVPQC